MAKDNSPGKKSSSNPQAANYDSLWKQIIEELLEPFLDFFFPLIYADIDFSRGYEVKSKELYKLLILLLILQLEHDKVVKDQHIGKRYTDELIKVYLKDGTEKWMLNQGYYEVY